MNGLCAELFSSCHSYIYVLIELRFDERENFSTPEIWYRDNNCLLIFRADEIFSPANSTDLIKFENLERFLGI